MKPGYRQFFQLNDIHDNVIETKPTEHFRGVWRVYSATSLKSKFF